VCAGPDDQGVTEKAILSDSNGSGGSVSVNFNPTWIVRMYDGDTSDEDNYIGYGVGVAGPEQHIVSTYANAGESVSVSVRLYGFTNGTISSGVTDIAYADLDGFHFVCIASAPGLLADTSTPNASSFTSFATKDDGGDTYEAEVTINSLQYYTYPS
jgi:hypothetical protein